MSRTPGGLPVYHIWGDHSARILSTMPLTASKLMSLGYSLHRDYLHIPGEVLTRDY